MDPMSALSLACNVIAVVDAAVKTAKGLRDLYDSSTGFSTFHQRLSDETTRLEALATDLSSQSRLALDHSSLDKVTKECEEVTNRIRLVLEKCRVKKPADGIKALAVFKAWNVSRSARSEIRQLHGQLQGCRERIHDAVAAATR